MLLIGSNRYAAIITEPVGVTPALGFGVTEDRRFGLTQLTAVYRHPVMGGEDDAAETRTTTAAVLRACQSVHGIPSGNLGPGFESSKIQTSQVTLESGQFVLLTIKSRFEGRLNHLDDDFTSNYPLDSLMRIDERLGKSSPYLAVVKSV